MSLSGVFVRPTEWDAVLFFCLLLFGGNFPIYVSASFDCLFHRDGHIYFIIILLLPSDSKRFLLASFVLLRRPFNSRHLVCKKVDFLPPPANPFPKLKLQVFLL